MPERSLVLFDLYGTLADVQVDEDAPQLWRLLTPAGVALEAADLRDRFRALCAEEAAEHGHGNILTAVFRRLLTQLGQPHAEADVSRFAGRFRELSITRLELRPYTRAVLDRLRRHGARVCLVSNTESILTAYDLDRLRLSDAFDAIVLSSDLKIAKPDPGIIDAALRHVASGRDQAVIVGDTWGTDVQAGLSAGIPVVFLDDAAGAVPVPDRGGTVIRVRPDQVSILAGLRAAGVAA